MIISKVIYPRTIVAKIPFGINEILYVSALPTANIRRKVLYIVITGDTFTQYVYDSGWISGGATQIQSDWNQTTTTALDYIKNKPTISGINTGDQASSDFALNGLSEKSYNNLTDKPTIIAQTEVDLTIAVADWSAGTTAVKTVAGVTATSTQLYNMIKVNQDLWGEFNLCANAQATDQITFVSDSTPTSEIVVKILIQKPL